jgi:hypothetical protein
MNPKLYISQPLLQVAHLCAMHPPFEFTKQYCYYKK